MSTLDTFVQHTRPPPKVAATSQEIRDRASTFVGYALRARSAKEAEAAVSHIRRVLHGARPASHEIAAWRWMTLKPGRTGLGEGAEDDFEVQSGSHDDGERWGGSKILNAMKEEGVLDAVVVVSRWYGGVQLGPARFTHITTCAREVCRAFKIWDELEECITSLTSLDAVLESLRAELAQFTVPSEEDDLPAAISRAKHKSTKPPDYSDLLPTMDVKRAKRLITARENAIKIVKATLVKKKAPSSS